MEQVYLVGSEAVQSAANSMRSAAEDMKHAAREMEGAFQRHQQFLNEWLANFEAILSEHKP